MEGVTAARVRVSRRTARVAVATPVDDVLGVEAMVRQRATGTLDALSLVAPPAVKVRVHHVPAPRADTRQQPRDPTPQQSGAAGQRGRRRGRGRCSRSARETSE